MPDNQDGAQNDQPAVNNLPGVVVSPGATTPTTQEPATASPAELPPAPQPPVATSSQPASPETGEPNFYHEDKSTQLDQTDVSVTWTASEYISHQKTRGWYGALAGGAIVVSVVLYFLTKDFITAGFVIFGAVLLGYYASRQPNEQHYKLSSSGVDIGDKHYPYDEFRSFSILEEGAFMSVVFMPLKRFSPLRAIYFSADQSDQIVEILTPRLPFEERSHDAIDRLMDRIRF